MIGFVGKSAYKNKEFNITVVVDSDFASDVSDHRSFTGFMLYVNGYPVDWVTRKQQLTATSTGEAEYIALSEASKAALHLYQLMSEFFKVTHPITVLGDSTAAQQMAENNISSRRTKHIWIIYRFVSSWIERGFFRIFHVNTKDNLADYLTKIPKDTNFVSRSALMFKNINDWITEVVCYNTVLDPVSHVLTVCTKALRLQTVWKQPMASTSSSSTSAASPGIREPRARR